MILISKTTVDAEVNNFYDVMQKLIITKITTCVYDDMSQSWIILLLIRV